MSQSLTERYDDRIAGVLSCYDRMVITGTLPDGVLRRRDDAVSLRQRDPHLRLPAVCRDAARSRARAGGIAGRRGGGDDRAHRQEPHPQGGRWSRRCWNNAANTPAWCTSSRRWRPATPTSRGTTSRRTRPSAAGQRQVPALLFLFHGCQVRADLSAGADMGTVPPAILLQRPQLAGAQADGGGHRLHHGRQRLRADRRLAARPGTGRHACRPTSCTACWTAMPRSAARCSTCSGSPTTGA